MIIVTPASWKTGRCKKNVKAVQLIPRNRLTRTRIRKLVPGLFIWRTIKYIRGIVDHLKKVAFEYNYIYYTYRLSCINKLCIDDDYSHCKRYHANRLYNDYVNHTLYHIFRVCNDYVNCTLCHIFRVCNDYVNCTLCHVFKLLIC